MPSSPTYNRNYKKEMATATGRGEDKTRAKCNTARRQAIADGRVKKGDGKDIDHVQRLATGGSNAKSNTRVVNASTNRARNGHSKGKK